MPFDMEKVVAAATEKAGGKAGEPVKPAAEAAKVETPPVTTPPLDLTQIKPPEAAAAPAAAPAVQPHVEDEALKADEAKLGDAGKRALARMRETLSLTMKELDALKKAGGGSVKPEDLPEFKELQTKYQEAVDRLGRYDLSSHPAFAAKYVAPIENAKAQAATLLKQFEVKDEVIRSLPSQNMKERLETLKDVPLEVRSTVISIMAQHDQLRSVKDEALKNHKQTSATDVAEYQRKVGEEQKRQFDATTGSVLENLRKSSMLYKTGDAEWNKVPAALEAAARAVLDSKDGAKVVEAVFKAQEAIVYENWWKQSQQEIATLRAELAKYGKVLPKLGDGGGSAPAQDANKPMTPAEAAKAAVGAMRR